MFDISYAAAYELGRFLAIKNEEYAKALYRYKKAKSRYIYLEKEDAIRKDDVSAKGITIENLPYSKLNEEDLAEDREFIQNYLEELALLKEIPHWYLIPDPHLLPQRTIRTFQVDFKWIQSLWLGALSLGGRFEVSAKLYEELVPLTTSNIPHAGFFLRSDLVWAYPEMVVNAKYISTNSNDKDLDLTQLKKTKEDTYTDYIDAQPSLPLLRQEELTPEILMVLTDQDLNYLSLALPPEVLHYGSDVTENTNDNTDLFTTNKLYVAGKCFSVVWIQENNIDIHNLDFTYELGKLSSDSGAFPELNIAGGILNIALGEFGVASTVDQLKTILEANSQIKVAKTGDPLDDKLIPNFYDSATKSLFIAGKGLTLTTALGSHTPQITYSLIDGSQPTVDVINNILTIVLGNTASPTSIGQLKAALIDNAQITDATILDPYLSSDHLVPDAYNGSTLFIAGKNFDIELTTSNTLKTHRPRISYRLKHSATPTVNTNILNTLKIELGKKEAATTIGQLKTALEGNKDIQSVTTDSGEEERLLDDSYLKTSVSYVIAGHQFTLIPAIGHTLSTSNPALENPNPKVSYDLGATPTVSIANEVFAIDLGTESCASTLEQLKIALEADPKIDSVDIGGTDQATLLTATDPSTDKYNPSSKVLDIGGISITLTLAESTALDNHTLKVSYTLQSGAIPIIAVDGSGVLNLQLGKFETPTSLRALKSMLEKQVEIQAVSTSSSDTAKLFEVFNSYTQSSQELCVAGKKFTLTMKTGEETAINDTEITFDSSNESTPELSLSGGVLTIKLGQKATPDSIGKLKTALVKDIDEIASVETTEDLNTLLLPEGYLKTEKEFVIAGRVFTLQLAENQETQLDDIKTLKVSYVDDVSTPTVNINGDKLDITLGDKDSPTTVKQLKEKLLEDPSIVAVSVDAADNELLIFEAYMQNILHIAGEKLTLSYHKDLLDDHVPLVRDVLADGSQPKVSIQDRKLVIDVGGKQSPTEIADLKTALEAKEEITEVVTLSGTISGDKIHPYKRFTYKKDIKYAGNTVGNSLDISDLVNNQGIVAVSELASGIQQHLTGTKNYTDFASAHLSRFMLEGEPKVEFSAGGTN